MRKHVVIAPSALPALIAAGERPSLRLLEFRPTGVKAYLKNGSTLEKAAAMANHASIRNDAA